MCRARHLAGFRVPRQTTQPSAGAKSPTPEKGQRLMAESTGKHRGDRGRHDSGQTSTNPQSGTTGKHDATNSAGKPAKDRSNAADLTSKGYPTPGKTRKTT